MNMHESQPTMPAPHRKPRNAEPSLRGLDLSGLLDLLRRRWPLMMAVAVFVLFATVGLSLLLPVKFDATVRIKINPNQHLDLAFQPTTAENPDQQIVDSEVSIMRSRDIAAAVARDLNLVNDPEFNADLPDRGPRIPLTAAQPVPEEVVDAVGAALDVNREPETYIVDLSFRSSDPGKSAAIANAFANEYINASVNRRSGTAARQSKVLDNRLASLGAQVQAADERVAQYRSSAGITENAASGTITDQQIAPLSGQLATSEAAAAAARSNVSAARAQIARGGIDAVSSVLNSAVIADLRRQRAEVGREQAQISSRYGPRHPETIRVNEQLAGLDRQIKAESERIVSGLESDAASADASASSLRGQLSRLRGEQASETRSSVVADSLQRQADAKRTVYNQLAQAANQTAQEQHSAEPQGAIIDSAAPPLHPAFPRKSIFALFGGILGIVLGFFVILLLEMLSTGIRTVEDVEQRLGVPFLASVPLLSGRRLKQADGTAISAADFVVAKPMSTFAEALRTIRSSLALGRTTPSRVIAIASTVPGEGKTTTAIALARVMAMSGERVILVDCDLRRGSVGQVLGASREVGLVEVLEGKAAIEQAIMADSVSGLDVLPLIKPSFTPKDLFSGEAMKQLIQALAGSYDCVLLDTPPLLAVNDARTLATLSDEVVMVIRWEATPLRAVRTALSMLEQDEARIAGAVVTMTSPRAASVGADNPAYYYAMYRQYHDA